jgi:hypothetical protein
METKRRREKRKRRPLRMTNPPDRLLARLFFLSLLFLLGAAV